jgi:hypothetical protein
MKRLQIGIESPLNFNNLLMPELKLLKLRFWSTHYQRVLHLLPLKLGCQRKRSKPATGFHWQNATDHHGRECTKCHGIRT